MPATDPASPTAPSSRTGQWSVRVLSLLLLVALVVYGLDQLAKWAVVENMELYETRPLLGEVLQLYYVTNPGAAFSLASGFTWILSAVAIGVVVVIAWFSRRIRSYPWALMLGLVLGGAIGNLTDRLVRPPRFGEGHVIDYIQVIYFPAIFNIADIAIVCSMVVFVILTIRGVRLDGTRIPSSKEVAAAEAAAADTSATGTSATGTSTTDTSAPEASADGTRPYRDAT